MKWRMGSDAGVTRGDLALFTRSLARLVGAGLPLADALRLAGSVPGGAFVSVADDLCGDIRSGKQLAAAMQAADTPQQTVFGAVYVSLVGAAEAGGALGRTLDRLADYLERTERLVQSVRSALVYPALLLGAAFISLIVLLVFVVPRYEALFDGLGQELPLLTRIVIGGAGFLRDTGWLILAVVLAGGYYLRKRLREPDFQAAAQARLLRLPVVGLILAKITLERAARTLAELIANGVTLPEALMLAAESAGSQPFAEALRASAGRVREGMGLSQALALHSLFPEMLIQLVKVGEESGSLDSMLTHLADIYALDVEAQARRLIALLEPVLILLIGLVMAVVIVGLISAIMSVNDLVVM